jgi:diguanylate cyclase
MPDLLKPFARPIAWAAMAAALVVVLALLYQFREPLLALRLVRSASAANGEPAWSYHSVGLFGLALTTALAVTAFVSSFWWATQRVIQSFPTVRLAQGSRTLTDVLATLSHQTQTNAAFARFLDGTLRDLEGAPPRERVAAVVKTLVEENHRLSTEWRTLTSELERSAAQLDRLRVDLDERQKETLLDPLTGVKNRRALPGIQSAAIDKPPLSIVMCDIDHFKRLNDTYGHTVGDKILAAFGQLLTRSLRNGDDVVRYGGEEFLLILPRTNIDTAAAVADRMRKAFSGKELRIEGVGTLGGMTASFGAAQLRPEESWRSVIQRADAKLYEAKSKGRNRVECDFD